VKTVQEALEEDEEILQASMGIAQPDEFPRERMPCGSDYSSLHTASPREDPEPDLPMDSDEEWERVVRLGNEVRAFFFS
jgi:hypothetical protein